MVHDIKRAVEFYKDILGLKVVVRKTETGKKISELLGFFNSTLTLKYVKLAGEGYTVLELYQPLSDNMHIRPSYFCHVAYTVKSIDEIEKKLHKYHRKFICKPQIRGNNKVVMIRDLDGNLIELVEEGDILCSIY
jgi:catechol 2,3-dioxygenase-like lactoylglutathione lyase family enzyme